MSEPVLEYSYSCPSCSGSFSIPLDRIPPVRARFPCSKCGEPMDFPSRDQAQILAKLQREAARRETAEAELQKSVPVDRGDKVFRMDKRGWEDDFLDRRAVRNLIRAGEILETDNMFTGDGKWVVAGELTDLKPLFDLKRKSKFTPPRCCRTHTDRVAHFFCRSSDRPLCEECAPEKKYGANMMRVCAHCGGTISDLVEPASGQQR